MLSEKECGPLDKDVVLFVSASKLFGGVERLLVDLLSAVDHTKVRAIVASREDIFSDKFTTLGIPAQCVEFSLVERGQPFRQLFPKWLAFFRSLRPQRIVLMEGMVPLWALSVTAAARVVCGRNVFLFDCLAPEPLPTARRMHFGFLPGLGLWRQKEILGMQARSYLARHTIAVGQGVREKLIAYYRYSPRRVSTVYHGVDTERFCPSLVHRRKFRRQLEIPEDATVIVSHGRLDRIKRVDRILKAFDVLSRRRKDIWLLLTAYGLLTDTIRQMVSNLAARDRVKFVGFVDDTSHLLQAADIYVLASDNEGFPLALLEAMSAGLICVATASNGPQEVLGDGRRGLLVERSDAGVLEGLERALGLSSSERRAMQEEARTTVVKSFDLNSGVRRTLRVLNVPCSFDEHAANLAASDEEVEEGVPITNDSHNQRHHLHL